MHPLIAAQLAKPLTHSVITKFEDGTSRNHDVRSMAQAENYAVGERRKVGRYLVSRETGESRKAVSVEIVAL